MSFLLESLYLELLTLLTLYMSSDMSIAIISAFAFPLSSTKAIGWISQCLPPLLSASLTFQGGAYFSMDLPGIFPINPICQSAAAWEIV